MSRMRSRAPGRRTRWLSALLFVGACGLGSCRTPTEIIVVFDTDLRVPDEVDAVDFRVLRQSDGVEAVRQTVELNARETMGAAPRLPLTISLEAGDSAPGLLTVEMTARKDGQAFEMRSARDIAFSRGQVLMLRLDALTTCRSGGACPAPRLEPWTGTPPALQASPRDVTPAGEAPRDSGTQDTRTGTPPGPLVDATAPPNGEKTDAGFACDADLCPANACVGTTCACSARQSCMQTCSKDQDCQMKCQDEGTNCDVQSAAAKSTSVSCTGKARCGIAGVAHDAQQVCEDGAWCDFGCAGPSCQLDCRNASCRLRTAVGAESAIVVCSKNASCTLELNGAAKLTVWCQGSDCDIRCGAGVSCQPTCNGGARCLVACTDAASCGVTNCPASKLQTCPAPAGFATLLACNRDCPAP